MKEEHVMFMQQRKIETKSIKDGDANEDETLAEIIMATVVLNL
jgi:hypothetical protein